MEYFLSTTSSNATINPSFLSPNMHSVIQSSFIFQLLIIFWSCLRVCIQPLNICLTCLTCPHLALSPADLQIRVTETDHPGFSAKLPLPFSSFRSSPPDLFMVPSSLSFSRFDVLSCITVRFQRRKANRMKEKNEKMQRNWKCESKWGKNVERKRGSLENEKMQRKWKVEGE